MLVGQKDKEQEVFNYLHALLARIKKSGLTLIEILITTFILLIVFAALSFTLNVGNLSSAVSAGKLEVQQDVRRAMDWMIKDLRQTNRMMLWVTDSGGTQRQFNNLVDGETFTNPIFNLSKGYTGSDINWTSYQIEYTFDEANNRIIRTDHGTNQDRQFNYIANLTFMKSALNLLRVNIMGEKTVRGNIRPTFTLEEEVRLRN